MARPRARTPHQSSGSRPATALSREPRLPLHAASAPAPRLARRAARGRIAAYALGPDYHDVVKAKAGVVADAVTAAIQARLLRASTSIRVRYLNAMGNGGAFGMVWTQHQSPSIATTALISSCRDPD